MLLRSSHQPVGCRNSWTWHLKLINAALPAAPPESGAAAAAPAGGCTHSQRSLSLLLMYWARASPARAATTLVQDLVRRGERSSDDMYVRQAGCSGCSARLSVPAFMIAGCGKEGWGSAGPVGQKWEGRPGWSSQLRALPGDQCREAAGALRYSYLSAPFAMLANQAAGQLPLAAAPP